MIKSGRGSFWLSWQAKRPWWKQAMLVLRRVTCIDTKRRRGGNKLSYKLAG